MKGLARIPCADCVYWNQLKPTSTIGHCRAKAPTITGFGATWPTTESEMWCGDRFDGDETFVSNLARAAESKRLEALSEHMKAIERAITLPGDSSA